VVDGIDHLADERLVVGLEDPELGMRHVVQLGPVGIPIGIAVDLLRVVDDVERAVVPVRLSL
jgi:hypothetical protein